MKTKANLFLCVWISLLLLGCSKPVEIRGESFDGLTRESPFRVDADKRSFTMLAVVNGKYMAVGTRHALVSYDGSNGRKAVFMGLGGTQAFYDALMAIKATPGNNMNADNAATTHVQGDPIEMTVKWEGSGKSYDINEVVKDTNGKPIELHFGGNQKAAAAKKTGCQVCLDSCPVGIISNAAYTYGAVEARNEVTFFGRSDVLPSDGTLVAVTFSVKNNPQQTPDPAP